VNSIAGSEKKTIYLQNGNLYFLGPNEYLAKQGMQELIITSDNIIGSPKRYGGVLEVTTFLEPLAFVGEIANIQSSNPIYNGPWQILAVKHKGTISGAICGEATTTLELFTGNSVTTAVTKVK
jgi:hypothetical protein